jgi:hypothetical protein
VAWRGRGAEGKMTTAVSCGRAAYARSPAELKASAALTALVEGSGRYASLVEAYESRLGEVDAPERSRLLQKIGEICEAKLGRDREEIAGWNEQLVTGAELACRPQLYDSSFDPPDQDVIDAVVREQLLLIRDDDPFLEPAAEQHQRDEDRE